MFSPLLPIAWLAIALDRRVGPLTARCSSPGWPVLLFYCFWGPTDVVVHAISPAGIPAVILAALLLMRDLRGPLFGEGGITLVLGADGVLLFLIVIGFEYRLIRQFDVLRIAEGQNVFPDASRWAESKVLREPSSCPCT